MTSAQVVETSVTVTSSSLQNYTHPDDHTRQTTEKDTPGFKPFTVPESIIFLAGGHLSRRIYAVVGRSTAMTEAADMACIPSSLTSSRWLIALAPSSAPSWIVHPVINRHSGKF